MYWIIISSGVVLALLGFYLDRNSRQAKRIRLPARTGQRQQIRKS